MTMNYFTWVAAYRTWKEAAYRLNYAQGSEYGTAVAALQAAQQAWIEADLAYVGHGMRNPSESAEALLMIAE
jgi:hypothetical protein